MQAVSTLDVAPEHRFLTVPELLGLTKRSRATLYRWISESRFPPLEKLGPNSAALRLSDYQAWADDPAAWADAHRANQ